MFYMFPWKKLPIAKFKIMVKVKLKHKYIYILMKKTYVFFFVLSIDKTNALIMMKIK